MKQSLTSLRIRLPIPVVCAVLAHLPLAGGAATYDFDDGTMQGWQLVPPLPANQSFAAATQFGGTGNDLSLPHSGSHALFQTVFANRDVAHQTLWARSPAFRLARTGDLTFHLIGGTGNTNDPLPTHESQVPVNSVEDGHLFAALRDTATGQFVLRAHKPGNNPWPSTWQQVTFTEKQMAALDRSKTYTLELIDARHAAETGSGGWGWVSIDSVTIPTVPPGTPFISDIQSVILDIDQASGPIYFNIDDPDTPVGQLTVTAASSNPELLPDTNIDLAGSDYNREIAVTPAAGQSGAAFVTVTVSDGVLSDSVTFAVVVGTPSSLVAEDPFLSGPIPVAGQYQPGNLVPQEPFLTGWDGPWLTAASALGVAYESGLSYAGLATSGGKGSTDTVDHGTRIARALAEPFTDQTTGTYYLSLVLMLRLDDPVRYRTMELHDGGFDDSQHRKLQLGQYGADFGTDGWAMRAGGQTVTLGDTTRAGTSANLFVLKFEMSTAAGGDTVTVWHNPAPASFGGAEPPGGATIPGLDLGFDRVSFASWQNMFWLPAEDGVIYFDELRLGTNWAEVTPPGGPPQPEPDFLAYHFEGSLEGWATIRSNTGYSPQAFEAAAGGDAQSGAAAVKQRLADNWPCFPDVNHETLWIRSPEFHLNGAGDLTFWIFGGNGTGAMMPNHENLVPPNSLDMQSDGGFHGIFLRNADTGDFVLAGTRSTSETNWQQVSFSAAQLAALDQEAVYTLDAIDAGHNGGDCVRAWFNFDTVRIPGTLAATTPQPAPFQITDFTYDPAAKTYRLTWNSEPSRSYTLRHSTDLALPGAVVQTGIPSAGTTTTWPPAGDPPAASPLPSAPKLFFYLEEEQP